ncbi:MAG: diacylglycerol kinase [Alphaproteobacteria bacterium]|nr:diacylglycerol kinase [Alphaproteobacteria bacterium]
MYSSKPVPREAVLVINAHSRRGQALFRKARLKLKQAGITLIAAHAVKDPAQLDTVVQEAVASGAPMVIVGGGDGSLSSSVDFLVDRDCVFALLPLGTANSFARTLGIPLTLEGAIETIVTGRRRRIDLGVIDGDYFANTASMGLSPLIGDSVPHNLKKYLGRFAYLVWGLWCLTWFKPFRLTVDDGRRSHDVVALEVRIANGRFVGGVEVVEDTDVDSGDIVVQAVVGHARRILIWNWIAMLARLPARRQNTIDFRGKTLRVTTTPPLTISVDGEVAGETPATVEIAARAIEVVVPASPERESSRAG